jgi:holliday junction DNA helicase RuvA
MIASVSGEVMRVEEDFVVVAVGGVGLMVHVAAPLRSQLRVGETVFLYTYLVVREDLLSLYGFESREEESSFRLLLGVNGVGPKMALAILSALTVDAVRRAVLSEQPEILARVPGVGRKTAQKIILYLQGKISGSPLEISPAIDADTSVLEALTALGYSVVEAQAALQSIPRDTPHDVETRLRLALQYFSS